MRPRLMRGGTGRAAVGATAEATGEMLVREVEERGPEAACGGDGGVLGGPAFELAVLALGFGLCRVWVVGCMGLAASFALPTGTFQLDQVFLLGGAALACVVAALSGRLFATADGVARLNRISCALLVSSVALMALVQTLASASVLVCAFALAGAASGVLQVMWGERFVRHSVRLALLAAPLAAVVTALVMMVLPSGSPLATCAAPLLSLAALCAHRGESGSLVLSLHPRPAEAAVLASAPDEAKNPISTAVLARLMASIAVFSLVGRCLDSFPVAASELSPVFFADNYAYLAILLVGVLFCVLVVALGRRFDAMMVYRMSLPLMVAGFVVLTLFVDTFTAASIFLITVGYEFFDVLFWAMLVGVVRQRGRAAVPTFGWGVGCTYAGMALGTLLSRSMAGALATGVLDVSSISLVCILVLVLLVVLVLPEGIFSKIGAPRRVAPAPGDDALPARCALLARSRELTPREAEVLVLLARGRTLAVVARELGIAEGTARTHMTHVYAKLGVHRQQELIDLVEAQELPAGGE